MNIEKNVPMGKYGEKMSDLASMYEKMEVGDSIFFQNVGRRSTEAVYPYVYFKMLGKGCSVRIEEGGIRVWRTK